MSAAVDSPIFGIHEAAQYLRVGPRVVYRLIRARKIAFIKIDGRGTYRIHRDELDAFVARRTVAVGQAGGR